MLHSNFIMKPSRIFIVVPLVKVVWTDIEQTDNDSQFVNPLNLAFLKVANFHGCM